jgi:hypothetical protein
MVYRRVPIVALAPLLARLRAQRLKVRVRYQGLKLTARLANVYVQTQ